MSKKYQKPPMAFGVSVKCFSPLGLHPQLTTINRSNKLGPGQYNPHRFHCEYRQKSASWKVKLESEEFSKFLGFRFPELLQKRWFDRTLGGPGNYDLFDYKPKIGTSTYENVGFGCQKRFTTFIKYDQPPPGSHNIKTISTRFNDTPTFEFDGFAPRFRNTEPPFRKAPNRYSLPNDSISDKIVSKRGPYDTFTGPRDGTTIKNHFAPPAFRPPDQFFTHPSDLDHLLEHKSKKRCGNFFQAERFPEGVSIKATKSGFTTFEKQQNFPGPAYYQLNEGIKREKDNLKPFNSSNVNCRPPTNWAISPGPERYSVSLPKCKSKRAKNSWMFLTKDERNFFFKVPSYTCFSF